MENQNNRLITYPSTVEKTHHHTVVLIDCSTQDFMDVLAFLKTSKTDFDASCIHRDHERVHFKNGISSTWVCIEPKGYFYGPLGIAGILGCRGAGENINVSS